MQKFSQKFKTGASVVAVVVVLLGIYSYRKLQALAGTITGTIGKMDTEALREGIAKSLKGKGLVVARDRIELSTLRFSVVCSTN